MVLKSRHSFLADGNKVPGEVVGSDVYSDIAVVRISADKAKAVAEFGDSNQLTVGETAIAIGSPLGTDYAEILLLKGSFPAKVAM